MSIVLPTIPDVDAIVAANRGNRAAMRAALATAMAQLTASRSSVEADVAAAQAWLAQARNARQFGAHARRILDAVLQP